MKRATQSLPVAVLLAARAAAQTTTVINNTSDTGVVTTYIPICPTATTTTVTLSTTKTLCAGAQCATITPAWDVKPITSIGSDGKTTVYEQAHYTAPCPCDGGICDAVYVITRACPCTDSWTQPTAVPGFATAAVACNACAKNGGPSTVIVVTPISNGPYASQTPAMGAPYNGAYASAGAYAYASAGPNGAVAGAGASAMASAGNGNGYAVANAGASASAMAGNSSFGASSNANANANAIAGNNSNTTVVTPPITSALKPAPYTGTADKVAFTFSGIFGVVIGAVAFFL